jgi:hypothetical protein
MHWTKYVKTFKTFSFKSTKSSNEIGRPDSHSVNPAKKKWGEQVTVVNLDDWLYKLTKLVAKLQED